ncbi:kelch-like protein 24 [Saccoglossus kowalevskii]|uniref:Kelch-like protein 24-like n=1 Tax=Saccoglossus kowalevskii TaxID=10224 RepID=A0ABM0GTB2_SACKO|nr:PREDICTED: kelch-like protein 24-like [Saccoglossus kowalevskii]
MATASVVVEKKRESIGETIDYSEANHSVYLLKGLNELKSQQLFTDITLVVGRHEYPCHRAVLASCSPYFRAMFTNDMKERNADKVQIKDVQVEVMNVIIQFIYTSKITISPHNVQAIFEGASLLQVHSVQDVCARYFERLLSPNNCLGILEYADTHSCVELQSKAQKMLLVNFVDVCKNEEFFLLSKDRLIEILATSDLYIDREEVVCDAICSWVNHDRPARESFLPDLLVHVRLPFLSPTYLGKASNDPLLKHEHLAVAKDKMLERTRTYYAKSRDIAVTSLSATKPRNYTQVLLTIGGQNEDLQAVNCIYCYDPVTENWSYLYELPDELFDWDLAVASLGTDIFVAGKRPLISSLEPNFPAWIYKGVKQRWMKVLPPQGLETVEYALTSDDSGIVYVLGGYDSNMRNQSNVRRYIVATNTWDEIAPMPMAASNLSATICEGKIYTIGGYTGTDDTSVIQCYDPKIDKWNFVKPLPITVRDAVALTMNNCIYLLTGVAKSIVYRYDPCIDKWSQLNGMAKEVFMYGATVCNNSILAVGGYSGDYFDIEVNKTIQKYDTDEDCWDVSETMPHGLHSLRCTTMYRYAALGT